MSDARADRANIVRSVVIWAIGLVSAIIVAWVVASLLGRGTAPGLVFGAAVFLILPYLITMRDGRSASAPSVYGHDTGHAHDHAGGHAHEHAREVKPVLGGHEHAYEAPVTDVATAPADVEAVTIQTEPVEAVELERPQSLADLPVMTEPVDLAPSVEPVEPARPQSLADLPPGDNPISERVREAARAAGQAARALSDDAGTEVGTRPAALAGPRDGRAENLKRIKGVGPKFEALLNGIGMYHFDQIADWGPDEIVWIESNIDSFAGRVERDDWVGQARILAGGGETEFSQRVDRGDVY